METRANHLLVGVVTLIILAALAWGVVWLARLGEGTQKEYDIFFAQSVSGLANGSQVSFAGVPVGQVSQIRLWDDDPEFVRVRISVRDEVPILEGTTATIQGSFTGVSTILLDGARAGAPPLSCTPDPSVCVEGVPVIPPKDGGLNALLADAPLLLERLATLTERLTQVLDDDNQTAIAGILRNTETISGNLADTAPEVQNTLVSLQGALNESQGTLREASNALAAFEQVTRSTDSLLNEEGANLARQLRATLNAASGAAEELQATLAEARPAARRVNESTLPAAEATLRDLQATSKALRRITEQLEQDGARSLLGSRPLPDYEPED